MMDIFNQLLPITLKLEGGYVNDDGIPTNHGVRQDIYDRFVKMYKLERKDVRNLTYGEVKDFYSKEYYERPKLGKLPKELQLYTFDYGVNSGPEHAIRELQTIVGAKPDGILGPNTLKAIEARRKKDGGFNVIRQEYLNKRAENYYRLVQENPEKNTKNINGWLNRINTLSTLR